MKNGKKSQIEGSTSSANPGDSVEAPEETIDQATTAASESNPKKPITGHLGYTAVRSGYEEIKETGFYKAFIGYSILTSAALLIFSLFAIAATNFEYLNGIVSQRILKLNVAKTFDEKISALEKKISRIPDTPSIPSEQVEALGDKIKNTNAEIAKTLAKLRKEIEAAARLAKNNDTQLSKMGQNLDAKLSEFAELNKRRPQIEDETTGSTRAEATIYPQDGFKLIVETIGKVNTLEKGASFRLSIKVNNKVCAQTTTVQPYNSARNEKGERYYKNLQAKITCALPITHGQKYQLESQIEIGRRSEVFRPSLTMRHSY